MSRTAKIVLAVVGGVLAVFAILVLVVILVVRSMGGVQGLADQAEEHLAAGRDFASSGHAQEDCLSGSLAYTDECRGFSCAIKAQLFAQSCLELAPLTEGLCDEVPDPFEITASAKWQTRTCSELGQPGNSTCQQSVASLQAYCDR